MTHIHTEVWEGHGVSQPGGRYNSMKERVSAIPLLFNYNMVCENTVIKEKA